MKSIAGFFFRTYGMTMVFATAVSCLSHSRSPLMAAYMFKTCKRDANGNFIEKKPNLYNRIMAVFPKTMDKARILPPYAFFRAFPPGVIVQIVLLVAVIYFTFFMVKEPHVSGTDAEER